MVDVQIQSRGEVEFACVAWEVIGPSIKPIPGTWTLPPHVLRETFQHLTKEVVGLFSCPHCNTPVMLTRDQVEVDAVKRVASLELFRCAKCPFACKAVFQEWDKRKLYCVAFETPTADGGIEANKQYFHAIDLADANHQFRESHRGVPIIRIVGVAPVIGFFINDSKGDKLSV